MLNYEQVKMDIYIYKSKRYTFNLHNTHDEFQLACKLISVTAICFVTLITYFCYH